MPQRRQGRSFTILGDAQLIHAGQHVAQLHDEGGIDAYAGIRITTLAVVPGHGIGQHAVPIIPGEVFAQQRARAAWIPRPHMSHMDGAHRTQQRILLGAVQQPRSGSPDLERMTVISRNAMADSVVTGRAWEVAPSSRIT